ncbi:Chromosome segregation ATPase [Giardia duodenalis assemblage B]|uniref:Chromosome segregation ATPase n=2 Tax=Giardia intestinalis TaxID=5741 RepID=A0A132NUN6_GIAIN|nr:Chromosome segregation ATPase [Giardia intestinalis]KWX13796.1 Chromosome segregation ATPase [Giardia intestinalis assemblage B]
MSAKQSKADECDTLAEAYHSIDNRGCLKSIPILSSL